MRGLRIETMVDNKLFQECMAEYKERFDEGFPTEETGMSYDDIYETMKKCIADNCPFDSGLPEGCLS
jgi:hypothetical protein